MWSSCEDRLQSQIQEFLSNDDALSRVRLDYFSNCLEAVVRRCSVEKMFLEISQNPHQSLFFNNVAGLRPDCFTINISAEQLLFQSNQFNNAVIFVRAATSSGQLFSWCSYFSGALLLGVGRLSAVFRAATFSGLLIFRRANLFRVSIPTGKFLLRGGNRLRGIWSSGFRVGWRTAGRVQLLFLVTFLLVLTKFSIWQGDWALSYEGYHSIKSFGNSYIPYL